MMTDREKIEQLTTERNGAMAMADRWRRLCETASANLQAAVQRLVEEREVIAEMRRRVHAAEAEAHRCKIEWPDQAWTIERIGIEYRVQVARAERAEAEVARLSGCLVLNGWWCICDIFNAEEKESRLDCRSCGVPKTVRPLPRAAP
jgi:hypothetical protein